MQKLLTLSLMLLTFSLWADDSKGLSIAKIIDQKNSGFKGIKAELEMVLINAQGDQISRKMRSYSYEVPKDGDKSLIVFDLPRDLKCTAMLTWSHKDKSDDQWLYLPSIRRVKRISPRGKSNSFLGSEFSYEDLSSQELEEFTYKFISEDSKSWVIDQIPVDNDSIYIRQRVKLSKKYYNALEVKYFNARDELVKTAQFKDFKAYDKYWWASEVLMTNHQTHKKSIMKWIRRDLTNSFSGRQFSKNYLKKCGI